MIARSRKRGYSDDTIIDTAVVRTISATSSSGNSSHVHIGVDAEGEDEDQHDDEVEPEVEQPGQHDGERDHQARELRLAHDPLLRRRSR